MAQSSATPQRQPTNLKLVRSYWDSTWNEHKSTSGLIKSHSRSCRKGRFGRFQCQADASLYITTSWQSTLQLSKLLLRSAHVKWRPRDDRTVPSWMDTWILDWIHVRNGLCHRLDGSWRFLDWPVVMKLLCRDHKALWTPTPFMKCSLTIQMFALDVEWFSGSVHGLSKSD